MIGWIIRETYGDLIPLSKFQQTLHELGAPTVALRSIICMNDDRLDLGKALSHCFPPINQSIHQTITGHFRDHTIEKDLIEGGQENAHRGHRGFRLKVMVGGLG